MEFPNDRKEIEEALISRPVELADKKKFIRNDVEMAFNSCPVIPGLGRNWMSGETVEQILLENEEALKEKSSLTEVIDHG